VTKARRGAVGGGTPGRDVGLRKKSSPRTPQIARSSFVSALVIETATTYNAPPHDQPWPPTGLGDGWHLVRSYPDCKQTLWRRVRLRTRAEVTRRA
jgi:hypothetical protein